MFALSVYATQALHGVVSGMLLFVVASLVVGALGASVERFLLRRTHAFGHAYELLLTFGLFFMIGEAVRWIWGSNPLQVAVPAGLVGSIPFLGSQYPLYRLFIL